VVQNALGTRTTDLAVRLLFAARSRLHDPLGIVLFTDGWLPYESLFPAVFGRPFQPQRRGKRGRFPRLQYRIPRTSGHVRIIKSYQGKRVTDIRALRAAGSQRRIDQELATLGYTTPNTSAVERHNATARRMNPHQVRRSLAFARLPHVRQTVSDLVNGVYNFCRVNRSLQTLLDEPVDPASICTVDADDGYRDHGLGVERSAPGRHCGPADPMSVIVPAHYPVKKRRLF
jgi:IS1 family transposase